MPEATDTLSQLRTHSVVVADTGDFGAIRELQPQDATTNPSLIYQAAQLPQFKEVVTDAITRAKAALTDTAPQEQLLDEICDQLAVAFGCMILEVVPGLVSTEVDASLSFDTQASIERGRKLIKLYEARGISKERVLVKLATTWEGCQACKVLQAEGIRCNMTLLFSMAQAVAAAEADATLISPFVGRILDWHKKASPEKVDEFVGEKDPGVQSVKAIYAYYKRHGYKTIVMGASFRNTGEIVALSGCDKLTISPKLIREMQDEKTACPKVLSEDLISCYPEHEKKISLNESHYRWMLNEDAMATEKLGEGIRSFNSDLHKLRQLLKKLL